MTTKTITITEDAYRLLAREKNKDESFSELIKREFSKKTKISDLIGLWGDISENEYKEMLKAVTLSRQITKKIRDRELKNDSY